MPCVGRVEKRDRSSTEHVKAAGRATNHTSNRNRKRTQRPNQPKAEATEQQTAADPKVRNTSTGTGTSHHPTHTHTHNAGEGGRAGQASTEISRRPVQSAAEGARPRHSREQRGGVRHGRRGRAVAACWEQCWQKERCWPDALRAHSRARGCVRCTLTSCVA